MFANIKKSSRETKITTRSIQGRDINKRKTINQYSFLEDLGKGSFAKVKLAVCGEKKNMFAIKIFDKEKLKKDVKVTVTKDGKKEYTNAYDNVKEEIEIMKCLDHPNVIKMHEVIDDEEDQNMFIVLDYAAKKQLLNFNNESNEFFNNTFEEIMHKPSISESDYEKGIRHVMRNLVNGLEYIHNQGIIHRDLKPENILVDGENVVKIADFGVALKLADPNNDKITGSNGTLYFMSPECCKKLDDEEDGYSGKASDIWSLGVCLYALITKKLPFVGRGGANQITEVSEAITNQEYPKPEGISSGLEDLLAKLLAKDAKQRIDMEGIKKHSFMTNSHFHN